MKKQLLLIGLLLYSVVNFGQHQNDHWYFGVHAHLNFSGTLPTQPSSEIMPSSNSYFGSEGSASVSDYNTGELLLYSDGVTIFGFDHQPISNGTDLMGDSSSSQNIVFLPKPGDRNNYFAFTTNGMTSGSAGLFFSEITINPCTKAASVLNNTLGVNVTQLLDHFGGNPGNEYECITTAKHSNGIDYWVIAQYNDYIYSYLVTSNGVVNGAGMPNKPFSYYLVPHPPQNPSQLGDTGKIKISQTDISTNVVRIAKAIYYNGVNSVKVGTFNRSTGAVVFNNTYTTAGVAYGLEFSYNGDILYYGDGNTKIKRRNLITNTALSDWAVPVISGSSTVELQLAADGNIYVSNRRTSLGRITNANLTTATYSSNAIALLTDASHATTTKSEIGLPQLVQQHPIAPAPTTILVAVNDSFSYDICNDMNTKMNVKYKNPSTADSINGAPITSSTTGITVQQILNSLNPVPATGGITIATNGNIIVDNATPLGTYTLKYKLLANDTCPSQSNEAIATINVVSSATYQSITIDNAYVGVSVGSTSSGTVLSDVTFGGVQATESDVVITVSNPAYGITVNPNGTITVPFGTPSGHYSISYMVCQKCMPSNCSDWKKINLYVGVSAMSDALYFDSNGVYVSGNPNVFNNDTYAGNILNPQTVSLSYVANPYFTIDTNSASPTFGKITIIYLPTTFGLYQDQYTICELSNTSNCSSAYVILSVGSSGRMAVNETVDLKTDKNINKVTVYPNPSSGVYNIQLSNQKSTETNFNLTVHNVLGQKVIEKKISQSDSQIDLTSFENGTYFLKFQVGDETINKIIVKK